MIEEVDMTTRGSEFIAHYHFARQWAGRNDERVHVFANGHVYDKTERRRGLRQCVGVMRREKQGRDAAVAKAVAIFGDRPRRPRNANPMDSDFVYATGGRS